MTSSNILDSNWIFLGDEFVILKRGACFISDTVQKLKTCVPLSEEDKERALKNKEERLKIKAQFQAEAEYK